MSAALFQTKPPVPIPTDEELQAEDGDNRLSVFMSRQETELDYCKAQIGTIKSVLEVRGVIITDEPPPEPEAPEPVKPSLLERLGVF